MNRIRELREARGMTQLQLAYKTGISPGMISRYETGYYTPGLIPAMRLTEALGCEMEDLIDDQTKARGGIVYVENQTAP